jgi:hypothetical protein
MGALTLFEGGGTVPLFITENTDESLQWIGSAATTMLLLCRVVRICRGHKTKVSCV